METFRDNVLRLARRAVWRGRLRRAVIAAAAAVAGVSLLTVAAGGMRIVLSGAAWPSVWLLPAAWVAAAGIGAATGMLWPIRVLAEAARIDRQRLTKDRLATAVELARSRDSGPPAAEVCYRQAVDAVGSVGVLDGARSRAGRSWLVAAALAVVLSATIWALAIELRRPMLASLDGDEQAALAGAFRDQAAAVGADELRRALADAAGVIETGDEQAFQDALAELRRQGFRPAELTPEAVRAAGALMQSDQAAGPADATPTPPAEEAADEATGWTRVYHPAYTADGEVDASASAEETTDAPFEATWSAARLRAGESLRRGDIPAEYRQIVRRYFSAD